MGKKSRVSRVNTRRKPEAARVKGKITPLEMQAFKHRVQAGSHLKCYRPHRKGDEEIILDEMEVIKPYPYIVRLSYHGADGKVLRTSMTWAEAMLLNRMTQDELTEEVYKMRMEKGMPEFIT